MTQLGGARIALAPALPTARLVKVTRARWPALFELAAADAKAKAQGRVA
jgi:hypothetical protein